MKKIIVSVGMSFCAFIAFSRGVVAEDGHEHEHAHGHGHGHDAHAEEPVKGPHGGRLLTKEGFALEVTIFEKDVPPHFRVFAYQDKEPLDPKKVTVQIVTTRFGGTQEEFVLSPNTEFLSSPKTVEEPHSFDVQVIATSSDNSYAWTYQSHEGRTELSDEALKVAHITTEIAGPKEIGNAADVYGRLFPNQDRIAHIKPRFSGIVKEIKKELGDRVKTGEILALIESNQSLQVYEVRSQIEGEVLSRHATVGEFVAEGEEVFVVGDLSEVWADFQVYRDDLVQIEKGQIIKVKLGENSEIEARVRYVSPVTDEATQSKLVRAVIPNPKGNLRPGLFVSGTVASSFIPVPIAVRREAIQTFRDWNVVYLTDGHTFQAMPVELGRKDSEYVEVLSGISAGDRYVSKNSFIIKADVEKAGASHDH